MKIVKIFHTVYLSEDLYTYTSIANTYICDNYTWTVKKHAVKSTMKIILTVLLLIKNVKQLIKAPLFLIFKKLIVY